jgi:hypothetical protein
MEMSLVEEGIRKSRDLGGRRREILSSCEINLP